MIEDYEETTEADEDELCRDIQMKLPDCLWQLDYVNRYRAGKFNEDFAALETGEKFLFGVIEIPFTEEDGSFTWGVWAEVDAGDRLCEGFSDRGCRRPRDCRASRERYPRHAGSLRREC